MVIAILSGDPGALTRPAGTLSRERERGNEARDPFSLREKVARSAG